MRNIQVIIEFHGMIFSVIAGIFLLSRNHGEREHRKALTKVLGWNICMLLSDIFIIIFRASTTELGRFMVPFCNFTLYLFQILITLYMGKYINSLIRYHMPAYDGKWIRIVYILSAFDIVLLVLNIWTGWYFYIDSDNLYHRGPLFVICILLAVLAIVLETIQVIRCRKILKNETWILMTYFLFPMIGLVIQMFHMYISSINIGINLSILFMFLVNEYSDEKRRREQERILLQGRAYLLNSQIKPHFLFNSLSVIQSLIEEDPNTAVEAVGHFSKYLRKNLNLTVTESAISVWEELDFTKNYLYMEKLRFGDKINIVYDLDESLDFQIPFLSIQPLAENAIRHGIRKKLEGGTLLIRIFEDKGYYKVQVKDDGVGFNPDNLNEREWDSQSNGVGVKNVEERIGLMCHGSMTVESRIGEGTIVTISIAKRRD